MDFIIMRGLPGSGKSFLSEKLVKDGQIFSTDDYFYLNPEGTYQWDRKTLGKAHKWNQRRVIAAVEANLPVIIVDNTNITLKELRDYAPMARAAKEKGYFVHLREPETHWRGDVEECFNRNSHGLPLEAIERMKNRYQDDIEIKDILSEKEHCTK